MFNSAMMTYYELGIYFKAVADKLGQEKAMQLHEDSYHLLGEGLESMLREAFPEKVDLVEFGKSMHDGLIAQGFTSEYIVEDDSHITLRNTRCPRYEGMKMAGHSDEVIEEHCHRGVQIIEKHLQNIDPAFRFYKPLWDAPNGRCDERFSL